MDVVWSLGSNQGDSLAVLQWAVNRLAQAEGVALTKASPIYQTAPVGFSAQPDFFNLILLGTSTLSPSDLVKVGLDIEAEAGRIRTVKNGPRVLDIDVIDYGHQVFRSATVQLPHPRAFERAFVLVPWLRVDSEAHLAGWGKVSELLNGIDQSGVQERIDLKLEVP